MQSHQEYYQAILANDKRFDGVFFVAVKSTGIYCRPICKVKAPLLKNCTFYKSAPLAESHGYRPCLRCRPELAPGYSEFEQDSEIVKLTIQSFEQLNFGPQAVKKCASMIGISSRHLSRVFKEKLGVSPMDYIMTKRLLMAKRLLTDTHLKITDIALASGFGSLSRFNTAFKKHYTLTPSAMRKSSFASSNTEGIMIQLTYRGDYPIDKVLHFLKHRAIKGVEHVAGHVYMRSIKITHDKTSYKGWLHITFDPNHQKVLCLISESLLMVLHIVVAKIKRVFDLDFDPSLLPDGIDPATRIPGSFDAFEMSTRAILGQQITVKAAHTIAGRVATCLGEPIKTPWAEINTLFPDPSVFVALGDEAQNTLGTLGVIKTRTRAIQALATEIVEGRVSFEHVHDVNKLKNDLMAIKGIGQWTADYLTMRALSWPDIFLQGDVGVRHALQNQLVDEDGHLVYNLDKVTSKQMTKITLQKQFEKYALKEAEIFSPWRSYYTFALWNSLSESEA